jgi:ATP-dependent RNA helicase RhlE
MGCTAAEIHSNLSLSQRQRSLAGFKLGTYRVLVATDIAARGIDVTNIELVINYDLPESPDDYLHRVGRTGRAGRMGQAISFLTPDQQGSVRSIERLVRKPLLVSPLPELPADRHETAPKAYQSAETRSSTAHRRTIFPYPRRQRQAKGRFQKGRQSNTSSRRKARVRA